MGDTVRVQTNANVALVKYWGKADEEANLPATGSLSISLAALTTTTLITRAKPGLRDQISLNGESSGPGVDRISSFLDRGRQIYPFMGPVKVESTNDFPTGAGLASSASGFAALAIGSNALFDMGLDGSDVSRLARLGSGSAARSVFGGFVAIELEGDGAAKPIEVDPNKWPLTVFIAVTDSAEKSVGSTDAMRRTADSSPFYQSWVDRHPADMAEALRSIEASDFDGLANVSVRSCLNMHATIMGSSPPIFYWNPGTLVVVQTVERWREEGRRVFYTIDAGPQVKVVCHRDDAHQCRDELHSLSGVRTVIESGIGGEPAVQWR
ncbi:MAG: diphosphomevalonate decarboxylase [Gammaproteobacteria bacterium]|uniref:diphosphomevalonate decarboxylase n=1 Tax=OM182 bacterium MED-G24 TaxID=1986255 RepID=A0A2A5X014_9GAMM|nr:diphosphomevalonate decarboxylase [Gammaproteobacteria bacterium]PDH41918.1 MAG: diphosphomevalonate decarboxylase [OM182 bacterium MED-G24]RPG27497.1 MAG: diphosphomevalonate decarboxylase [Gammaproteobacteria bacterium TMED50]